MGIGSILYRVSHPNIYTNLEEEETKLIIKTTTDSLSYSSCNFVHNEFMEILSNYNVVQDELIHDPETEKGYIKLKSADEELGDFRIKKVIIDVTNVRIMD